MGRKVKISGEEIKTIDNNLNADIEELAEMTDIDPQDLELIVQIRRDEDIRGRQERGGPWDRIELTEEQEEWLKRMDDYFFQKKDLYELFCTKFEWPHSPKTWRRRLNNLGFTGNGYTKRLTDNHKEWLQDNWTGDYGETWKAFCQEWGEYCGRKAWTKRVQKLGYESEVDQ